MTAQREPERRIIVWLASGRMVELLFRREGELTSWRGPMRRRKAVSKMRPSLRTTIRTPFYFITRRQLGISPTFGRSKKYSGRTHSCP